MLSRTCRGVLVSCWTSWGQQGSKFGQPLEYRGVGHHLTLLGTICNLMAKEKERMQSVQMLWGLSIGVGDFWCYDGIYLISAS